MMEQLALMSKNPNNYSPLTLAYIGDAVFEIFVRTFVVENEKSTVNVLHSKVTKYVNATAQSEIIKKLMPMLTDEELNIFKRGRNAKVKSAPKNSSNMDYHYATGFEALIGYLFIKGDIERLEQLFDFIKKSF